MLNFVRALWEIEKSNVFVINGAPNMTVNGVDLNRDGISNVLQQPQLGVRRLSSMEDQ